MAYNNRGFDNYNNGNSNNNRNNDRNNNNSGGNAKKHSGCKFGRTNNKPWIQAWNYSRRNGMVTFIASPYEGTKQHKGATQEWENWVVKIKQGFTESLTSGLYSLTTGKLVISSFGIVCNSKAPNGGYCGKFSR